MPPRADALISIGTNSTRLLVHDGIAELAAESRATRLGAGLQQTGRLDSAARERTLAAIAEYMEIVRQHDARVACIATSAMRRAADGDAFAADVGLLVGAQPRVLSGHEEAMYSFLGATAGMVASERIGVLDVGGGSTELAVDVPSEARARGTAAYTRSVEIGAVRLAERHPAILGSHALHGAAAADVIAAARADVAPIVAPFGEAPRPARLVAVGGTAFTAAAMIAAAPLRDGVEMPAPERDMLLRALLERTLDERKLMAFIRPQRADILPAGLIIVDEVCRVLGLDAVAVAVEDLLAGFMRSPAYAPSAVVARPGSTADASNGGANGAG
jgi:exopolyphosphatase/guanosine-5'-triphosphate,3'-diphosphate pyrophosphatase